MSGIGLSGFDQDQFSGQLSLFNETEDNGKKDKTGQIDEAMDKIRSRHGSETITFASLIRKEKGGK